MASPVKTQSALRRRQLELTRTVILDAATRLFVANGYVSTTVERIASEAEVAPSTVYAAFGTKVAILGAARWRLAQSAGILEVRQAVAREPDLRRRLVLLAGLERRLYEPGIELIEAMRVAAASDPEAARDWEQLTTERQANLDGALHGLTPDSRDIVRAMLAPDVYIETVRRGGWSPVDYERWLSEALVRLVATDGQPSTPG